MGDVDHPVPRGPGPFGEAVGPAGLGGLRQRHEKGGLPRRQPRRLAAEIREARRPDAFEGAAEGSQGEVELEDLSLAEPAFEFDSPHGLPELGLHRAFGPGLHEAGDLHRQGGAAGHDTAPSEPLGGRPQDGEGVDADMVREPAVLEGAEHGEVAWVHRIRRHRQAPAAIRGGEGAQQRPRPVEDDRRARPRRRQVEGRQGLRVGPERQETDQREYRADLQEKTRPPAPHP